MRLTVPYIKFVAHIPFKFIYGALFTMFCIVSKQHNMEKKTQKRKSTYKENRFILIKAMLQEFAEVNITSAVSL